MGRSPCCEKVGLKKGPWTPEEDQKLLAYIEEHGHGSWRALPAKAGLQRCGKSCRLRWTNYLRPDIKRGKFSLQEEQTIIQLHALLGNRWSAIATHIPKRTDNEIKNYWNTHLKKRLTKMGIDPVTHKPKNDALLSSIDGAQSKNAANLSHMAQWESARLEAEARLVRESKLRSHNTNNNNSFPRHQVNWNQDLESPINSTLTFSETGPTTAVGSSTNPMIDFVGSDSGPSDQIKEEGDLLVQEWKINLGNSNLRDCIENSMSLTSSVHDLTVSIDGGEDGFTSLLLNDSSELSLSDNGSGDSDHNSSSGGDKAGDYYEDNKNYWNSILNLVDSSPTDSPIF